MSFVWPQSVDVCERSQRLLCQIAPINNRMNVPLTNVVKVQFVFSHDYGVPAGFWGRRKWLPYNVAARQQPPLKRKGSEPQPRAERKSVPLAKV